MKKILFCLLSLLFLSIAPAAFAKGSSFVSIINPIRGEEFWQTPNQQPEDAVLGEAEILKQFNLKATWLIRFDALSDQKIIDILNNLPNDEKGLFLEVIPSWTKAAGVNYRQSDNWHSAGSAFLTGYERLEREKLIDAAFEKFKQTFGTFPQSVGAWWVDSYSLDYMQKKYGIISSLIVADQYSTDKYQIWGQFWSTPYYPSKKDALNPAPNIDNKLPVVMVQWAARDPVNAYGNGVWESTFSVQANDYTYYHNLTTNYFVSLVDIYTKQNFNKFNQITVGLENSYQWDKYRDEYKNQIKTIFEKSQNGQFAVLPMKDFANWYKNAFPNLSPAQIIIADDPLNLGKKAIWFMNPFYRAGLFLSPDGVIFRDVRQYVEGEEEICYQKACREVNFATFATRVLDEVTYGQKWVINEGRVSDFKLSAKGEGYLISYVNESKKTKNLEFLQRDISVDGKISSIDGLILDATKQDLGLQKVNQTDKDLISYNWSVVGIILTVGKFFLFLLLAILIPGCLMTRKDFVNSPNLMQIFLSGVVGLTSLTAVFYLVSVLKIKPLIYIYLLSSLILFIRVKSNLFKIHSFVIKNRLDWALVIVVLVGTIFQTIPTFKSGLNFSYGLGFWGPNTHDGVWHIALINQLAESIPPQNPIFSGTILKNYHFLYDVLIAAANYLSVIEVSALVFRLFPAVFSILLGIGTYFLIKSLFEKRLGLIKTKVAALLVLYFVYFAGSFGWIVEYLREKHIGGESAFWANQSVSFNLNPPFAISLLIVIAILHFLLNLSKHNNKNFPFTAVLLCGTLIGFKSYAGVLVLLSLLAVSAVQVLRKDYLFFWIFIFSSFISLMLFTYNFQQGLNLITLAPFWFVHSMVDSPDRVGWVRLSLARTSSLELHQWPKFILAEILSLVIFIIGNLGLRIFGLGALFKINAVVKDINLLIILILSVLSVSIPILFIQSGNPWNTIQFLYYFLYISALFSGVVLSSLVFKMPKILSVLIISLILVLTPINSLVTANGYLGSEPHAKIDSKELDGLKILAKQEKGVVLTYPYDKKLRSLPEPWPLFAYDSTSYVAAYSKKAVFVSDEPQNQILLTDYKPRLITSKDFFSNPSAGIDFLKSNNIKYIYLPTIFNIKIADNLDIQKIFENDQVDIYLVK